MFIYGESKQNINTKTKKEVITSPEKLASGLIGYNKVKGIKKKMTI